MKPKPNPERIFDEIESSIPDDLPERVLAAVQRYRGKDNPISRPELVQAVFGRLPEGSLSNSREDRQIRRVLPDLQEKYPILSSSGKGGYYYAESADEILAYAAELKSRAIALEQKSRSLLKLAATFGQDVKQLHLPL